MEQSLQTALKRFGDGDELRAYTYMGCHRAERDGVSGYLFRVWAPNAKSVSVVGDWNFWNPEDLPMTMLRGGVWEAFSVFAKEGGVDDVDIVKPRADLADIFDNEVGGVVLFKFFLVFEGVVELGKGHGAGFEPAV